MVTVLRDLWHKIQEPRVISVLVFLMYLVLTAGALSVLVSPPATIKGELGQGGMIALGSLVLMGGVMGTIAALPGIWWLERLAVAGIALGLSTYAAIILALHITEPGNRFFQFTVVVALIITQVVRWARIREYPYDPKLRDDTIISIKGN